MKSAWTQGKLTIESLEKRDLLAVDMLAHVDAQGDLPFDPRDVAVYQERVVFRGNDGKTGPEAWLADGNPENTTLLKDIFFGSRGSGASEFREFGGKLYFRAASQSWGHELWVSDGSRVGTQQVTDTWPGTEPGFPTDITAYHGALYFFANDGESGRELYRSDGTAGGTERVVDAIEGVKGVSGEDMMVIGDLLFFRSVDSTPEAEGIWVSDGTAEGTKRVPIAGVDNADIQLMTQLANQLVFVSGGRFYITDGTVEGGRELSVAHQLNGLAAGGGRLYVSNALGLHIIDPSSATSTQVSTSSEGVAVSAGKAYFWNSEGLYVIETDDTFTELVRFNPVFGTKMGTTDEVSGGMLFNINFALNRYQIWATDGTPEGTTLVEREVTDDSAEPLAGFQQIGDSIYFTATNGKPRKSLWKVPAPVLEVVEPSIDGDVNGDDRVDARDIDAVFAVVASGATDSIFDLNEDGEISTADGQYIATDILDTKPGDLDLNGRVDFADFLQLSTSFGKQNQGWSNGDSDGDGGVGFSDFLALSANFGFVRLANAVDE